MRRITLLWLLVLLIVIPTASGSLALAAEVVVINDVEYRNVDGKSLRVDIYRPVMGSEHPSLLLIHGGAWRSGNKREWAEHAPKLAQLGYVVYAVEYRLAPPEGRWHAPAQIQDIQAAIRWVREQGSLFGSDGIRVGALGASAGAHLALLAGTNPTTDTERLQAVISWSGPTSFTRAIPSSLEALIENYIGCARNACPDRWEAESPINFVGSGDAHALLATGRSEIVPLDQATTMQQRMKEQALAAEVRVVEGNLHGMELLSYVWEDSVRFLERFLRNNAPVPQPTSSSPAPSPSSSTSSTTPGESETSLSASQRKVVYGDPLRLTGTVSWDQGCSRPAQVRLHRRQYGRSTFVKLAEVPTDADGQWSFTKGAERNASYTATPMTEGSCTAVTSSPTDVLVKARVHARLDRCLGQVLTVAGRVEPDLAGTRVALQRRTPHGWRTLGRATLDARSRYRIATSAKCRGKLRVMWPSQRVMYEKGAAYIRP